MANELHTLSVLHSIRQELFIYNNSDTPHDNIKNLLETYIALLPEDVAIQTYLTTLAKLQAETLKTNFDLEKWRKLALEDENLQAAQNKMLTRENAKRSENNKTFKQEAIIKQKILNELRLKGCDIEGKDLLSVHIENNKKLFANFSDGSVESISIAPSGKKYVTAAFWKMKMKIDSESSSFKKKEFIAQQNEFLSPAQLQTIIDEGKKTFTAEKQEIISTKPTHKNITLAQYKKLAGSTEFIPNIEKEYEIYSKLSFIHQEQFLEEIKLRKEYMDKSLKVFKGLCRDAKDLTKLKQIADKSVLLDKLSETLELPAHPLINQAEILPNKEAFENAVSEVLTDVIENDIKGETGRQYIWTSFNKTTYNPRYSPYEILLDHAVSSSQTIHSEIFHFNNKQQMRNNLVQAFSEIKSQRLILPNSLTSEILCIGVFNAAMKRAQNTEDLTKMNEILNEFGLNIRFEERKITKVPFYETSNEYLAQERLTFREERDHKSLTNTLDKSLYQKFGEVPHKKEVHHFIPLRYNGFIDEELNQSANYVGVASQHDYNLDLHGLGHSYDTPSASLVKDEDGNISYMTYSRMCAAGLGKTLLIPILQVKTDKGFEDVLSNQTHKCLSTDKTPVCYTQIPEYITELMREKFMVESTFKKPAHASS